jgi:hypothetical protein
VKKMIDLCKCTDAECPMRQNCRRFTSSADVRGQSYFLESPREDQDCDYFLDTRARNEKKHIKEKGNHGLI